MTDRDTRLVAMMGWMSSRRPFSMPSYIIEAEGLVKEAFSYAQPLTPESEYALGQYARATYGEKATVLPLNERANAMLMLYGLEMFVGKPVPTDAE